MYFQHSELHMKNLASWSACIFPSYIIKDGELKESELKRQSE